MTSDRFRSRSGKPNSSAQPGRVERRPESYIFIILGSYGRPLVVPVLDRIPEEIFGPIWCCIISFLLACMQLWDCSLRGQDDDQAAIKYLAESRPLQQTRGTTRRGSSSHDLQQTNRACIN